MKKILALILAALMLLPMLIACGNGQTDNTATTVAGADTAAPTDPPEETEFAPCNIPEDVKFPGKTVSFMYWDDVERPEFFVETTNGDIVLDAIFDRNQRVEEQLGIKLEWIGTPGNYDNQESFVSNAYNSTMAGKDAYDIFAGYSLSASTLALRGITQNLLEYDILDFNQPWWPQSLVDQCTIKDKLYFASGDISTNFLYMMYGMFFNKNMYDEYHHSDPLPYEYVTDQDWTLDTLMTLCEGVYEDLNTNQNTDYDDKYGFMTIDLHYDAFFNGFGMKNVDKDANGNLSMSEDFTGQKIVDVLNVLTTFLFNSGFAFGSTSSKSSAAAFRDNRVLFTMDRVYIASGTLNTDLDFTFGMLPVPKYNKEQANYITTQAFPFTFYSLSTAAPEEAAAATTLQLMAYQSYCLITPGLFEQSMKARYSDEGMDSYMYDIIHDNVYFDLGRIFCTAFDNLTYSLFRTAVRESQNKAWTTIYKRNQSQLDGYAKTINEGFDGVAAQ